MPPDSPHASEDQPASVPGADEARAALHELEETQSATLRLMPGRPIAFITNLSAFGPMVLIGLAASGSYRHNHHVDRLALGGIALVVATLVLWFDARRTKRRGIAAAQPRRSRAGWRVFQVTEWNSIYLVGVVGLATRSWIVAGSAAAVVAVIDIGTTLANRAGIHHVVPSGLRLAPSTFYREFLDDDLWRVASALVVVTSARPGALADELGIPRDRVNAAIKTLEGLGYIDWSGKSDGRGAHARLNHFGRIAFRHQLAAYEHVASPQGGALQPAR